jgi:hypothetical protein
MLDPRKWKQLSPYHTPLKQIPANCRKPYQAPQMQCLPISYIGLNNSLSHTVLELEQFREDCTHTLLKINKHAFYACAINRLATSLDPKK